jgi:hypothetical protein
MKLLPTHKLLSVNQIFGYDGEGSAAAGAKGNSGGEGNAEGSAVTIEAVNNIVNNAIANLRKVDLPKIVNAAISPLAESNTTIMDMLKTMRTGGSGDGKPGGEDGSGSGSGSGHKMSPEDNATIRNLQAATKSLTDQINELKKQKEDADKKANETEINSIVREALGHFELIDGNARDTAFTLLRANVARDSEGRIIAGDNLTVDAFAKEFFEKQHPYLLRPVGNGGAGASGGSKQTPSQTIDLNDIKPGMSAEKKAILFDQLRALSEKRD